MEKLRFKRCGRKQRATS
uniref:Ribosomal protein S16 n=1 Tax=Nicotiana otophora TaxID=4091 RepID=A0A1L2BNJ2_NICOT|nr:ribosomal protein S16 [Nicotiana otophora]ALT14452.1 ribosomal protein S16 [Nicotiana otophora]